MVGSRRYAGSNCPRWHMLVKTYCPSCRVSFRLLNPQPGVPLNCPMCDHDCTPDESSGESSEASDQSQPRQPRWSSDEIFWGMVLGSVAVAALVAVVWLVGGFEDVRIG